MQKREPAVHTFFAAPPNCWDHKQVDQQVLTKTPASPDLTATLFDPDSIMEYPVAAELTTDHKVIGWNKGPLADRQGIHREILP